MIDVDAFVDLRDVQNGLRRMQLAGHDLRPVFRAVRKAMRGDMKDHAKKEQAPDGSWSALAVSTIASRKARAGKQGRKRIRPIKARRVKKLGRLPAAFSIKYDARSIKAISRVSWSGVHNEPKGATVGHGSKIPGRQFMWASRVLLALVARKAVDHLVGAWEKG